MTITLKTIRIFAIVIIVISIVFLIFSIFGFTSLPSLILAGLSIIWSLGGLLLLWLVRYSQKNGAAFSLTIFSIKKKNGDKDQNQSQESAESVEGQQP